jgi:hypothetical protein
MKLNEKKRESKRNEIKHIANQMNFSKQKHHRSLHKHKEAAIIFFIPLKT